MRLLVAPVSGGEGRLPRTRAGRWRLVRARRGGLRHSLGVALLPGARGGPCGGSAAERRLWAFSRCRGGCFVPVGSSGRAAARPLRHRDSLRRAWCNLFFPCRFDAAWARGRFAVAGARALHRGFGARRGGDNAEHGWYGLVWSAGACHPSTEDRRPASLEVLQGNSDVCSCVRPLLRLPEKYRWRRQLPHLLCDCRFRHDLLHEPHGCGISVGLRRRSRCVGHVRVDVLWLPRHHVVDGPGVSYFPRLRRSHDQ
mmetsp:Transcript_43657/g.120826  ORF Transcript_43657/g.120826 Transcript_43657/m.120826 type:complete len:255 (+) Transcript_43657:676-1440(+)